MHRIRFRLQGSAQTLLEELTVFTDLLARFKGSTSRKRKRKERRGGKGGKGVRRIGRKGEEKESRGGEKGKGLMENMGLKGRERRVGWGRCNRKYWIKGEGKGVTKKRGNKG